MVLRYLSREDSGGVAEWREMWNEEVLPYLRSEHLAAGPGIRLDRRPAETLIRVVPDGPGGGKVILAAVVTPPTSGGVTGTVAPVVIGSGGEITVASGAAIRAVFPFLDGYN